MLRELVLRDFKSFAEERAWIGSFTLLVGANASGKSNFVDALRFLHGLGQGWPIRDVISGRIQGGTRVWNGIRGGAQEVVRMGRDRFQLQSNWMVLGDGYSHAIETDGSRVLTEALGNIFQARTDAKSSAANDDLHIEWLPGSMDPGTELETNKKSVLHSGRGLSHTWVMPLRLTLGDMRFLDLQPSAMRDYAEKPRAGEQPNLASNGANLSAVLWALCQDGTRKTEFVDWLVEFCAPEIADIDFIETDAGDVLLRVIEQDGTRVSARSMSDGTLRFLGLLAALKTRFSTLVIEDLEHGLHPSRQQLLAEAIEAVTPWDAMSEAPVVVGTTHSPQLIDAALQRSTNSVLLFAKHPEVQGSIIRDVRSLPGIDDVRKRRDFGYLLNTGWLERAV